MNKLKIYTCKGDKGETSLLGGIRVAKNNARIEVIGEIDELSALLGIVRSIDNSQPFCRIIIRIQHELINFMSELADPNNNCNKILQENINQLETDIDEISKSLPAFTEFIAAGDNHQSSFLHLARTVCRRTERRLVSLCKIELGISPILLAYLNRLSDLLFVLSRNYELN
ncbi:MAG: cob(I)yrinic acid a,c-diamide adenosyltransferase [Planctomycetaceae bacterium]|jgi:cob(I)alamin adenosyltransferase|nr:cob(I)yrinic acid a,c-diamide adenosyltransferase [Planctomycetaceae bacterium]